MHTIEPVQKTAISRLRIIKNLIVLSSAFLLVCSAVDGLQMLQSTLNREKGIGVISVSIQFAFGCATALFLMKYIIMKFGSKNTITFCLLAHIPSTAANFYPTWELMIPSYILLGIAATLLWGSNSAYLNGISRIYSNICRKDTQNSDSKIGAKENFPHLVNKLKDIEFPVTSRFDDNKIYDGANVNSSHNNDLKSTKALIFSFKMVNVETDKNPELKNFKNLDLSEMHCNEPVKQIETDESWKANNQLLKNNVLSLEKKETPALENCSKINSFQVNDPMNKIKNGETLFPDSETWYTIPIDSNSSLNQINNELKPKSEQENVFSTSCEQIEELKDLNLHEPFSNSVESTTARFFGFHSMLYQSGHIWSNIISYFVLQTGVINENYSRDASCMCGADFCTVESECFDNNLKEPTKELKYVLISIFIAINAFSVLLVAFFLDPLDKKEANVHYSLDFALASLKQLKKPKQLLLVPLSIYMGMAQGFFYADFPKAFVGCAWGMHHVGFVTIFFGITCSIMSTLSAWMVKYLGRRSIFLAAAAVNIAVNILMLLWTPISTEPVLFFTVAGMWGFLMGSFWSQLKAFHGVLFKSNEEAAFGCYELSHSIGACISFAYSNLLCVYVKIYVLLLVSSVGMIGYLIVEKFHTSGKQK